MPHRRFETLPGMCFYRRGHGNPGFTVLAMDHQCCWSFVLAIHKKNDQLTSALFGPMMGTRTIWMRQTGNLQIKGWHDVQARLGQFLTDPVIYVLTALLQSQKRY